MYTTRNKPMEGVRILAQQHQQQQGSTHTATRDPDIHRPQVPTHHTRPTTPRPLSSPAKMGGGPENKKRHSSSSSSSSGAGENPNPPPSYQDQPPSYHEFATVNERYNYSGPSPSPSPDPGITAPPALSSASQSRVKPDGGYGGSTDVPRSEPIDIPAPKKRINYGGF
ncbi:hypothetical protein F4859DRAFT_520601 [Xylaria cf. heliscus]|nr:hypothetical protein F4859DRAFT_520601 [Xylaria cf. heliscus]